MEYLQIKSGDCCIDMTLGLAGHSYAMLEANGPSGRLLGLDRDSGVLELAAERLACFGDRVVLAHSAFAAVESVAAEKGVANVQAILFDLGVSSWQLDTAARGFSFRHDVKLDMRMDTLAEITAADIVNTWTAEALTEIFKLYGDERLSKPIAQAICRRRLKIPFETTNELAAMIGGIYKHFGWKRSRVHPATKVFQALRIAVNDELEQLKVGLQAAVNLLAPGGRMAVISFHSGEDRIVKHFIKDLAKDKIGLRLNKKPLKATEAEKDSNPRSRSALLRVFEKI